MSGGPSVKGGKPWQAARPGIAAARQDSASELFTLVAFDITCDKARRRVGEMLKDYGFVRVQWSVFEGAMTRNRREELYARILGILDAAEGGGRVAIYPIGARESAWAEHYETPGAPSVEGRPPRAGGANA